MNNSTNATIATNPTSQPTPNPAYVGREDHFEAIMVIRLIFTLIGVFGNGIVLFIISIKKKQKTNNDIYLLNLACADLLHIVFANTRYVYNYFDQTPRSIFYCKVLFPASSIPYSAGIFTITVMAIQRCRVILNPWKPKGGVCCAYLSVAVTWFLSILVVLPVTIFAQNIGVNCPLLGKGWSVHSNFVYFLLVTSIQYPIPLLIITYAYVQIGVYMSKPRIPRQSVIARGNTLRSPSDETRKESIQITKTVGVIVLLFVFLMLPLQIAMLGAMVFKVKEPWVTILWDYSDVLGIINSSLDPYVYSARTKEYREVISKWVSWLCPCYTDKKRRSRSKCSRNDRSVFPTGEEKCYTNDEILRTVEDVSIHFPVNKGPIRELSFSLKNGNAKKNENPC